MSLIALLAITSQRRFYGPPARRSHLVKSHARQKKKQIGFLAKGSIPWILASLPGDIGGRKQVFLRTGHGRWKLAKHSVVLCTSCWHAAA
jgi:hypothetical protein